MTNAKQFGISTFHTRSQLKTHILFIVYRLSRLSYNKEWIVTVARVKRKFEIESYHTRKWYASTNNSPQLW